MKKRTISILLVMMLVLSVALTGCGNQASDIPLDEKPQTQTGDNSDSATDVSEVPEEPVPLKWLGMPTGSLYPEKDALIVKEVDERFNVDIEIVKANSNRPEEMNLLFASGEIPDHIFIRSGDINMILEEELLREIPAKMVKEVAPTYYDLVMQYHPYIVDSVAYNKETDSFLAIPQGQGELFPFTVLRTDWLEKVGVNMPTNLEEFEEVCRLFTEEDPDGNDKDDTYAFTVTGNLDVFNLAAAFGISLPGGQVKDDSYIKGSDGILRAAEVTENYKELLKYVARLYDKGYIYPDVTVKDDEALFSDGFLGVKTYDWTFFIVDYRPKDWFALTFEKNPNATTEFMKPLVGLDNEEAVYEKQTSVWRWQCAGKNTSDEQLKKILEIIETQLTDMYFHNLVWRGVEGEHYTVNDAGMAVVVEEWAGNEKGAELGTRFFMANYRVGEQRSLSWGTEVQDMDKFQQQYNVVQQLIPSVTKIESKEIYGADIDKIEKEFFLNTITGIWDVDAEWDAYVDRWYKAGGDKIEKEVNETYTHLNK
ncbi:MAG: hypothetical protein ACOYJ1_11625 [Peptococcales bacterium]|jgi:putative aldouronate transport system substrate-binding protein